VSCRVHVCNDALQTTLHRRVRCVSTCVMGPRPYYIS